MGSLVKEVKPYKPNLILSTSAYSVEVGVGFVAAYLLQFERKLIVNIIVFLFIGLCSGFFAGKLVEGHGFGAIGDIIVGIVGAFVGGFFFSNAAFFNGSLSGSILTATLGSIIFLVVAGLFRSVAVPRKA